MNSTDIALTVVALVAAVTAATAAAVHGAATARSSRWRGRLANITRRWYQ